MAIRLLYRLLLQHLGRRRWKQIADPGMAPVVPQLPAHTGRQWGVSILFIAVAVSLAAVIAVGWKTLDLTTRSTGPADTGTALRLKIDTVSPAPLVVYLSGAGLPQADLSAKAETPRIESTNGAFVPRFQILPPGSSVEAVNRDPVAHNTHVFNRGETVFNVALPLEGVSVRKTVTGSEIFSIRCDLHPWMQAWLFVPPSRHYVVLEEPGSVEFSNIPPGEYLLHLWQPDHFENIRSLKLSSGETKTLRLR